MRTFWCSVAAQLLLQSLTPSRNACNYREHALTDRLQEAEDRCCFSFRKKCHSLHPSSFLRHFIHCLVAPLWCFQHLLESVELEDRVGRIPPFPCKEWSCRTVCRQVCLYLREKTSPTAESGVKGNDAEFGVLPDIESRGNIPLHTDTAALHTSAPRGDQ